MEKDIVLESIYIGTVKENNAKRVCAAEPGTYAVFYHIEEELVQAYVGLDFENLADQVISTLIGKSREEIVLTNGITWKGRKGLLPKMTFEALPNVDLEILIRETADEHVFFPEDFRKIVYSKRIFYS